MKACQHIPPIYDLLTQEEKIEKLLNGEIDIERLEVPEHVKEWLHWLKKTPKEREIRALPPIITPEDFREAFEVINEMTSLSPSGLHYTLWKALAENNELCKMCAAMMTLPFRHGFTHDRWRKIIDVMLEKKTGVRKIHLMRIIGLVEVDFNIAL